MEEGLSEFKKSRALHSDYENVDFLRDTPAIQITNSACAYEADSVSELNSLKREEKQLLIEKRELLDALDELQSKFDVVNDKRSRLLAKLETNRRSKQQESTHGSDHNLFSIVTWGSSWMDGLVFAVMAENDVWAKELVRQWLNSNERENHRIDTVRAIVSRDVRAIVNVGKILLDV